MKMSALMALLAGAMLAPALRCAELAPPVARTVDAANADALVQEFVYQSLVLSPVAASSAGYHVHDNVRLDGIWNDYSAAGIDQTRNFNRRVLQRLDAMQHTELDAERLADFDIIRDAVQLKLLELDRIQNYRHNPTLYVELIGNGLYTPFVLNYAPPEVRFQDLIDRLQRLPALVAQAKANLVAAPEVWNRVAREENDGNIELVDKTLREQAPAAVRGAYQAAAAPALQSLRDLNTYLATNLAGKTSDWRLGKENYERKCRYTLHTGRTPTQLLAAAEKDLAATRAEMARLAAPRTVAAALDEMASQHATPASYMDEARRTLAEATAFVKQKDLLTLADNSNLAVIDTPVYMRGIYSVGGFNGAPALEPQLGAFYWVTPIPGDWPAARVESKLREYNRFGFQQLTIHEAMPGHYVQAEYAHRIEPRARRLLRDIWGNGAYVEGWAVYVQHVMTDEGYLNNDPNLRLALLKWDLRSIGNTILDVRMQTMGMTEQQALDFMIGQTYQEREEAAAKWQRAQLSSCQLDMYYAGYQGWEQARAQYRRRHPKDFSLKGFHERALNEGAVPLSTLDRLLQ
jgi:uncharacterized protein (DUF885 family)